jgi:hypothetical protein
MLVPGSGQGEACKEQFAMRSGHWVGLGLLATGLLAAANAALPADHAELLPDDPAKPAVVATCTACHDATEITTRRMTADRWDIIVSKMIDLGAEVTDTDRPLIVAYLARNFSPKPAEPIAAPPPPPATNAPVP